MRIELLYFTGCPNAEPVHDRLKELLKSRGCKDRIELVQVSGTEDAVRQRFLGSPTVRIDGEDIEPGVSERTEYGITCRIYRTGEGLRNDPDDAMISRAIDNALSQPQSVAASARTPLRYRRLVFIGGLTILLGAFLGLLVVWGQALTVGGLVLVATAYANNGREHGRQPLMSWAAASGTVWCAATIAYSWLWRTSYELLDAGQSLGSVDDFQQPVFLIGLVAVILMLTATAAGTFVRFRASQRTRRPEPSK